ncbi:MAG: hypothetical protein IJ973_02270 [Christensenellaceae bacterium]|nr:hypothetical protein [Christensenellaceae bacterium]MBR2987948.1 hypothetical protein [Clostridia bacterium]
MKTQKPSAENLFSLPICVIMGAEKPFSGRRRCGAGVTEGKLSDKGERMMEMILCDDQIVAVNRSKAENFSDSLVYKAKDGFHQIDFEECAKNFADIHSIKENRCIGERNIEKRYVLLYTNGFHTKIVFRKAFVFPFRNHLLHGTRRERFLKLQALLSQTKYTTYDMT